MGIIYAIGGGNFLKEENLHIDKEIISETNKKHPRLLYIPAASNDRNDAIETFKNYFEKLGAIVDILYIKDMELAETKFNESDIIYFGGGMSKRLVDIAKKFNLKELIIKAYQKGKVIAGISAGAIMLFDYGFGDQYAYSYHDEVKGYRYVMGLGILKGIFVPHYQQKGLIMFHDEVDKYPLNAFALEDMTALKITENKVKVIKKRGQMVILFNQDKNHLLEPLEEKEYDFKLFKGVD